MRRSPPSCCRILQMPSSATDSEIIGPAGNDMQTFPPTVAVFQILNDDKNDRQHSPISGAAIQSVGASIATSLAISHVAAISRPLALAVNGSQWNPRKSI